MCYDIVNQGMTKLLQKEKLLNERMKNEETSHKNTKLEYESRLEVNRKTIETLEKDKVNLQTANNTLEKRLKDLEQEKAELSKVNEQHARNINEFTLQAQHSHKQEVQNQRFERIN